MTTTQTQADVLDFRRAPQRDQGRVEERTFDNIYELCAFVGAEIVASKRRYADIARAAHVCDATVSKLAHHETKSPRMATVLQILSALGFEFVVR